MRVLFCIILYCSFTIPLWAQTVERPGKRYVIKKDRIIDHEKIFTESERLQLDSVLADCWDRGIADIAIVTIDERHTQKENFDQYVIQNLTGYAPGEDDKNNGIVIALSRRLRQMRVQNGYDVQRIISDQETKRIIDNEFIPKFKEEKYFEGTIGGLKAIIRFLENSLVQENFSNASSIFWPSIFKKIRAFVLENGQLQRLPAVNEDSPCYEFTALDVFFGPSQRDLFVRKDFLYKDYNEMTIRDNQGTSYQFIYYDQDTPEKNILYKKMQPDKVYWLDPGDRFLSSDVWPLLAQIEDEIAQKSQLRDTSMISYQWVLQQEFDPNQQQYVNVQKKDTLSFVGNEILLNGRRSGVFDLRDDARIVSLKLNQAVHPVFAIFAIDGQYHYRYLFSQEERKLYLVPLDEQESHQLISNEGRTLLFEMLEK